MSRVFTTHTQHQVQMKDNNIVALSFRALISDASKFFSSSMSATKVGDGSAFKFRAYGELYSRHEGRGNWLC